VDDPGQSLLLKQPWQIPETQVVALPVRLQSALLVQVFLQVPAVAPEHVWALPQSEFAVHAVAWQVPDLQVPHQPQSQFQLQERGTQRLGDPEHLVSLVHCASLVHAVEEAMQVP
jgi:hypothetical protein